MLEEKNTLFEYLIYLGDNALILSHRLSEWCGHGPVLEQDIAMTNIALDILGQARLWYQLAASTDNRTLDEDQIAYLRDGNEFRNILLVEQNNKNWGFTIMRQFIYDCFITSYLELLRHSAHAEIAAIASRSFSESNYHYHWSYDWLQRLSLGTEKSKVIMQEALDELWRYHMEPIMEVGFEKEMQAVNIAADLQQVSENYLNKLLSGIEKAGLKIPEGKYMMDGGKRGVHSEHLGYVLAEMQYLQRAYPGQEW